jgi:hypothetical protein
MEDLEDSPVHWSLTPELEPGRVEINPELSVPLSEPDGALSRKSRLVLTEDDQKARLMQLCCMHFKRYLAGKEKFYLEMGVQFLAAEGVDVNVKGYIRRWVTARRKAVQDDITKSGVARHYGEFELLVDKWIQFVDAAAEQNRLERELKKCEVGPSRLVFFFGRPLIYSRHNRRRPRAKRCAI